MKTHQSNYILQRLREESSNTFRALMCALSALLITTQTVQAVETITYYHHDALGSPVAATDESGNLLWREDYKPYGERIRKPATDNKLWYTGKPEEPELGLQYFGARWYDPQLGRFTGIDPVGFDEENIQSFNRYAYAYNNPYSYIDPDGRVNVKPNFGSPGGSGPSAMDPSSRFTGGAYVGGSSGRGARSPETIRNNASTSRSSVTKGPDFYRGAKPGNAPDLTPRPNDFKVDSATGTVKPTHGVSVFDNPNSVSSKGFVPHKVDQSTIPDSLQIIQRGKDPAHFEITPKPGANLTPQQFIDACSGIRCSN